MPEGGWQCRRVAVHTPVCWENWQDFYNEVIDPLIPGSADVSIVRITNAQDKTLGTGFLVFADGLIATCFHVIEGKDPHIVFPGSEPRPARVGATDPAHDVATRRQKAACRPAQRQPARGTPPLTTATFGAGATAR
jgi:S1-C subfamily serine protease